MALAVNPALAQPSRLAQWTEQRCIFASPHAYISEHSTFESTIVALSQALNDWQKTEEFAMVAP